MSNRSKKVFLKCDSDLIRQELDNMSSSGESAADNTDEDPDFTPEDCSSIPKGNKLSKILKTVADNSFRPTLDSVQPKVPNSRPNVSLPLMLNLPSTSYAAVKDLGLGLKKNLVDKPVKNKVIILSDVSNRPGTTLDTQPKAYSTNGSFSKIPNLLSNSTSSNKAVSVRSDKNVDDHDPSNVVNENNRTPKVKRARRGLAVPDQWKRNKAKRARVSGEEYISTNLTLKPAKQCNLNNCLCPLRCCEKLSDEQRLKIFEHFYKTLKTKNEQTSFLVGSIDIQDKFRTYVRGPSKREKTRYYYLRDETGSNVRVCKKVFRNTLQVSDGGIDRALKGSSETGVIKPDARGKHTPTNKRSDDDVNFIVDFLNSIPRYKSHYTRVHNPNKEFFPPGLNKTKLYGLYTSKCSEESKKPVSPFVFTDTSQNTLTLGFTDLKKTHVKHVTCSKTR